MTGLPPARMTERRAARRIRHERCIVVKLSEDLWFSQIILILLHRFNGVLK